MRGAFHLASLLRLRPRRARSFSDSADLASPSLRSRKLASLKKAEKQYAVWEQVACKVEAFQTDAPTDSLSHVFGQLEGRLRQFVAGLKAPTGACGLAVFHGPRLLSLDLFHRADVFAGVLPKLLRGIALDLFDPTLKRCVESSTPDKPLTPEDVIAVVQTALESAAVPHKVPGIARAELFKQPDLHGFRLVHGETLVHLAALPAAASATARSTPRHAWCKRLLSSLRVDPIDVLESSPHHLRLLWHCWHRA